MQKALVLFVLLGITAVTLADPSLSDAYSGAISAALRSGQYQTLYQQWFGAAPRPVPVCLKFFPTVPPPNSMLQQVLDAGVVRVRLISSERLTNLFVVGWNWSFECSLQLL